MKKLAKFGLVLVVASGLSLSALPAFAQSGDDIVIEVPADLLASLLAACQSAQACETQIQAVIAQLQQTYPNVPVNRLAAAVAVEVAAAYDNGAIPPTLAITALQTLAAVADDTLRDVIENLVAAIEAGEPVNLEAFAEAGGSPS